MRQRNDDTVQYGEWIATRKVKGVYYARRIGRIKSKSYSLSTTNTAVAKKELIRIVTAEATFNVSSVTCGVVLDDWYASQLIKGGDTARHKSVIKQLKVYFNDIPATDFYGAEGYNHLERYKTLRLSNGNCGKGISLTTLNKEVRTLSASLNYAKLGVDPILKTPKAQKLNGEIITFVSYCEDNIRTFVLEDDLCLQLIERCSDLTYHTKPNLQLQNTMRLAILIALTTSARKSSILDLTWDRVNDFSIDFRNVELKGKRKKRPHNAISADLRPYLDKARADAKTNYVIEFEGKNMETGQFDSFWRILRDALINDDGSPVYDATKPLSERFCFHSLRHTCLTKLRRSSMHISKVSDFAGHSSTQITERVYLHADPAHQKEEANIASTFLRKKPRYDHNYRNDRNSNAV